MSFVARGNWLIRGGVAEWPSSGVGPGPSPEVPPASKATPVLEYTRLPASGLLSGSPTLALSGS